MRAGSRGRQKGSAAGGRVVVALGALSDVGKLRGSNQDAFCALAGADAPGGADAFLAVADGMGGHRAGEVASTMAVQRLVRRLSRWGSRGALSADGAAEVAWLGSEVQRVNVDVHEAAQQPRYSGMGTTLTAALLAGTTLFLAHVGDSRAYLLRGGRLRQLTRDHSWVAEEVATGRLTAEEAQRHPRRNVLTRALGPLPTVEVDGATLQLQGRDVLLLCSDGLHALVPEQELSRVLSAQEPQQACEELVQRANALGGADNITAVVLRIGGLPGDRKETAQGQPGGRAPGAGPGIPLLRISARAWERLSRMLSRRDAGDGSTGAR